MKTILVALCLVPSPRRPHAEGTWVLWEESNELHAFARSPVSHIRATYASVDDCIKAIDAKGDGVKAAWPAPDGGFTRLGPTSAVVMMRYGSTTYTVTYTCLPDSTYPPF